LNYLHYKMNFVSWAPVIFISAQKNIHIKNILPIAKKIAEERKKRLSPNQLNAFLRATLAAHPPSKGGRKITFFSVVQREVSPPIFRFLVSREDLVHFSYRRFLENELRRMYGFEGTAIRLEFWDK